MIQEEQKEEINKEPILAQKEPQQKDLVQQERNLQDKPRTEIIPVAETLKKLNTEMMGAFMELRKSGVYKLLPSFSNAIIKQLEYQSKLMGDILPIEVNAVNINLIKQEIVTGVNKLISAGDLDISKLNTKEFIDDDVIEVKSG